MIKRKLIRDRMLGIPWQHEWAKQFVTQSPYSERVPLLVDKVTEEVTELVDAFMLGTTEEFLNEVADVLEIVFEMAVRRGLSAQQCMTSRAVKAAERGGFRTGLVYAGPDLTEAEETINQMIEPPDPHHGASDVCWLPACGCDGRTHP